MITYPFAYARPSTLADAAAALAANPDAKLIAGGQTLIPTLKMRLANPAQLIDISRLSELSFIRVENGTVTIGAGTKHAAVEHSAEIAKAVPALAYLAGHIGDPAVRNMGTIGGSIANNDPAADYPAAALALGATIRTTRREIAADDFFTGMFQTALEDSEIICEIAFPMALKAGYAKFPNPASRYAMAGVFVAQTASGVRVAVTGAGACVFRVTEMEAALAKSFSPDAIAAINVSSEGMNEDLHGSAEYRAHLVTVMAKRAVAAALV